MVISWKVNGHFPELNGHFPVIFRIHVLNTSGHFPGRSLLRSISSVPRYFVWIFRHLFSGRRKESDAKMKEDRDDQDVEAEFR